MKKILLALFYCLPLSTSQLQHVVLIGIDGLDVEQYHTALDRGLAPNLKKLRATGVYTDNARAEFPSESLPNWVNILAALPPSLSGIHDNNYRPESPYVTNGLGPCVIPPTIFKALKTLEPDSDTAAYYKWSGIGQILYKSPLSQAMYTQNDQQALEYGIKYLKEKKPRLIFFYFDDVDGWGHASGFGKGYFDAIRDTDIRVGKIMSTIRELGMLDKTAVLIVSDHGRQINGYHHGDYSDKELKVSWLAWTAPEVPLAYRFKSNHQMETPVLNTDTPSTILSILGYPKTHIPYHWKGSPVEEIWLSGPPEPLKNLTHVTPFGLNLTLERDPVCLKHYARRIPFLHGISLRPFYSGATVPMLAGVLIGIFSTIFVLLVILSLYKCCWKWFRFRMHRYQPFTDHSPFSSARAFLDLEGQYAQKNQ